MSKSNRFLGLMRKLDIFSFATRKTSILIILTIMILTVLDSTIFKFAAYAEFYLPISYHVQIFLVFAITFALTCLILMIMARKSSESYLISSIKMKYFHSFFFYSQITILCILLAIIIQIFISNKYNVILLSSGVYLAYASTLLFLSFLIFIFAKWLKSKKNYLIILFIISFTLLATNVIVSIIYLESYFSRSISIHSDRTKHSIETIVIDFPFLSIKQDVAITFNLLSLLSFTFMWISTVILLSQYRYKLGRIKYFVLISLPLIYYVSPFTPYIEEILLSFIIESSAVPATFYLLILNLTKQIGALFFSIYFLIAYKLIEAKKLRQSLLISGIGIIIVFSSLEIETLQYIFYPPYGFITAAFMPLGSYLLFVGIFSSAQKISRNVEIRKELYESAKNQLSFLKEISEAQQIQELFKRCRYITKRTDMSSYRHYGDLEQKEVMEIIQHVLNELDISIKQRKDR